MKQNRREFVNTALVASAGALGASALGTTLSGCHMETGSEALQSKANSKTSENAGTQYIKAKTSVRKSIDSLSKEELLVYATAIKKMKELPAEKLGSFWDRNGKAVTVTNQDVIGTENGAFSYNTLVKFRPTKGPISSVHAVPEARKLSAQLQSGNANIALGETLGSAIASLAQENSGMGLAGSQLNTKELGFEPRSLSLILKGRFKNGQVIRVRSGGEQLGIFGVFAHHINSIHFPVTDNSAALAAGGKKGVLVEVTVDGKPASSGSIQLVFG